MGRKTSGPAMMGSGVAQPTDKPDTQAHSLDEGRAFAFVITNGGCHADTKSQYEVNLLDSSFVLWSHRGKFSACVFRESI